LVVLNAINLPDSVANLYFRPPSPDLQTLLYTTERSLLLFRLRRLRRLSGWGFCVRFCRRIFFGEGRPTLAGYNHRHRDS